MPGIPPFDPETGGGAAARALRLALAPRPVRTATTAISKRADPLLHSLTRGRAGLRLPLPFASLVTTGARSGELRTSAVLYFSDGDDVILIASNWGGDRHPGWYHNLRAHPRAELSRGGRSGTYTATEVTDEAEHARLFALAELVYPGYGDYGERTASIGRRIPIMRLRSVGARSVGG
ncbi:MAG: nitroreductase family deazaflavin-dependent oxidoreductase [Conexibacteraceae bacterium]|nr:nitroreductase family deazaflavin-dependent oxidoreductase [Conexibacteraceae bacterium]